VGDRINRIGAGAGYGWYLNPTISGPLNSGRAGYRPLDFRSLNTEDSAQADGRFFYV
jgi:hypothetical protein